MKITINNIKQYIEGHSQMILDQIGVKPEWYQEQIAYRMLKCKDDCVPNGKCLHCGCKVPAKLYVNKSCNYGERFPDLMGEQEWNEFKQTNNIN